MNLLLFPPGSLDAQGLLTVEGTQHKHLVEVLEAGVGDRVRVGPGDAGAGRSVEP